MGFGHILADAHAPCLSALFLGLTWTYDTGSQRAAGGIQPSCTDWDPADQTGFSGSLIGHGSHDLMAGSRFRHHGRRQPQLRRQIRIIGSGLLPEKMKTVALGDILGKHARQLQDDEAVALQNTGGFFINFRPVFLQPHHLRRRVAG